MGVGQEKDSSMSEVSWRSGENRRLPSSSPQRGVAEPTVKPESSLIGWIAGCAGFGGRGKRIDSRRKGIE